MSHICGLAHAGPSKPLGAQRVSRAETLLREATMHVDHAVVNTVAEMQAALGALREMLAKLPNAVDAQAEAAADLLCVYMHTTTFFVAQPYAEFKVSPHTEAHLPPTHSDAAPKPDPPVDKRLPRPATIPSLLCCGGAVVGGDIAPKR